MWLLPYNEGMNKKCVKVGGCCAVLFLVIILPALVIGKGRLFMNADFNSQQIPFNILCNKAIKNGEYFWNWNTDLGSNFIASYSFYNIGSPFFWIMLLVPSKYVVYAMGPLLVLKFMVSGCSSYLYLSQYVKNGYLAAIGAVLYTFSGFTFSNLFYNHFMDVIALFPLLLLALDQNVKNGKKNYFSIMVALMAMTNYVFFVMEVVFIILYFICQVSAGEYKITLKKFLNLAIESVLGFCASCIIVLPSVLDLVGNPRSIVHFSNYRDMLIYALNQYVLIIKAAFLPSDLQNGAALFENRYSCTELYLPMVGMIFVISFIIHCNKKKNFIFNMLIACICFSFVPVLNSSFQLFNQAYYTRWFFMFVLVLSLASIKAIENNYEIKTGAIISCIIICSLSIYLYKGDYINNNFYIWIWVSSLLGIVFTVLLGKKKAENTSVKMFIGIIFFVLLSGAGHYYNTFDYNNIDSYFNDFIGGNNENSPDDKEFYRTENKNQWNSSMVSDNKDIICWNSTVSSSIFSFYENVGAGRYVTSSPDDSLYGLRALLSVKYIYNKDNEWLNTKLYSSDNVNTIYENVDFLPMGFGYDNYISESEYQALPVENRHLVLLKALVLSDEDVQKYNSLLKKLDSSELENLNYESFKQDINERRKVVCNNFQQKKNGFSAEIDLKSEKIIFFSVPYEKGWTATINGEKAEILKVDDGLMAIKCPKGPNNIQFNYVPQGFVIGAMISVVAVLLIGCGVLLAQKAKR